MKSGNVVLLESQVKDYLPIDILEQAVKADNTCLRVNTGKIHWIFYIVSGRIVFGSNSIDCFERLDRHLKRLNHEVPNLPKNISSQLRLNFETDFPHFEDRDIPTVALYDAICSLAAETDIETINLEKLVARQTQEVLEMFLALPESSEYQSRVEPLRIKRIFCHLKLESIVKVIGDRLSAWESLAPTIKSPYEVPFVASEATACKYLSPDAVKKLHKTLRGYNFRQLGALHNQDDLAIARKLYPLIRNRAILLREPIAPFDLLPLITRKDIYTNRQITNETVSNDDSIASFTKIIAAEQPPKKIVCIDDSQAMLNEIERLLEGNNFKIHTINDSGRAMMKMASIKPDLVLLDVGMPNVDGYQLCSLIRKTSMLKDIPVVMVTGSKGLIDRAKAKLAGASDFLAKPFTQGDLLKIAFRYLT